MELPNDLTVELDEVCEKSDVYDDESVEVEIARLELCLDTPSVYDSLVKYKIYFVTSDGMEMLQAFGCFNKKRFEKGFGNRMDMNHILDKKYSIDGVLTLNALVNRFMLKKIVNNN